MMKEKLLCKEYEFLRMNEHLGDNIFILALGGSHAYGTNTPDSDLDIRGGALNSKEEILLCKDFGVVEDRETDTVVYSFNKLISLLTECNPNVIEILGCKPEHYLYCTPIGEELIKNSHLFLSQRAYRAFGGYASQQLHRLQNKSNTLTGQIDNEKHLLKTIQNVSCTFPQKFFSFPQESIRLYLDDAINKDFEKEIFMDVNLYHYPLRDYKGMMGELRDIEKAYAKVGKRNKNAILHDKIGKHMMHLVRLYYMCFDVLEKEQIITYRENEHDLLMDIRNGKYLDDNSQPIPEFYEMVDDLEKRLDYDKENTSLPEKPDYKKINELIMSVNERIVRRWH